MTELPRDFGGVPGYVMDILIESGYTTVESLKSATNKELIKIDGIGRERVRLIRKAIEEFEQAVFEKTEFVWKQGWNWQDSDDEYVYLNFKPGTQIKSLRKRKGSNELSVLVSV
jgi:hypothetical protein